MVGGRRSGNSGIPESSGGGEHNLNTRESSHDRRKRREMGRGKGEEGQTQRGEEPHKKVMSIPNLPTMTRIRGRVWQFGGILTTLGGKPCANGDMKDYLFRKTSGETYWVNQGCCGVHRPEIPKKGRKIHSPKTITRGSGYSAQPMRTEPGKARLRVFYQRGGS